jgi:O-antigen ligase
VQARQILPVQQAAPLQAAAPPLGRSPLVKTAITTAAPSWSERIGQAALYLLCFSAYLAPAGSEAATVLLLLAFLLALPRARLPWREPVMLLALAGAAYGVLHTLILGLMRPGYPSPEWSALSDWLKLLLFVPVAHFSRGDERSPELPLLLTLIGLMLGMLIRTDWGLLMRDPEALITSRPGFGVPALAFALYSGAGLLGLLTVGRRLLRPGSGGAGRGLLAAAFWTLATASLFIGLSMTSARSGWLALLAALPVALWASRDRRPGPGARRRAPPWWQVAVGLALAVMVTLGAQRALERGSWVLEGAATGAGGDAPAALASDRIRWKALVYGLEMWSERPWFGWGAGVSDQLIESSAGGDLRFDDGVWLVHLHNTYLEILVQYGAAGLLVTGAFLLILALGVRDACRDGRLSAAYCGFFAGVAVLVLVWSLFDYRLPNRDWRVFWMLAAGLAYGLLLRSPPAPAPGPATPSPKPARVPGRRGRPPGSDRTPPDGARR